MRRTIEDRGFAVQDANILFRVLGMAESRVLLFVAFAGREERIRIISARTVTQHEQDEYLWQNA